MKVFNETREQYRQGDAILLIDKKEGRILVDMLAAAAKANRRKRSWLAFNKKIDELLEVF